MTLPLRTLAALAAGGLATAAHAQQPPAGPAPPPAAVAPAVPLAAPQVVRWPGGVMVLNDPEVIVRQLGTPGRSTTVVAGSGNGVGNRIVVGNGGGGLTVVSGSRNGIGNRLLVDPGDLLLDLDLPGLTFPPLGVPAPAPAPPIPPAEAPPPADPAAASPAGPELPVVRGRQTRFWTTRSFSDAHDCNLYWHPAARAWYRYHTDDDTYRPAPNPPASPQNP